MENKLQEQWQQKTSKLLEIKTSVKPWQSIPPRRREQIILSRLRLGHTRLTHEYLLNRSDEPFCETCHTSLTVRHILVQCPNYALERRNLQIPQNLSEILNHSCNIKNLLNFLSD
ncbi:hypothetical protein NQ314_017860 [Rhamnusium bicolor]|uniref:Reverse transcriptase zinc-binding domain-containing protein n=1 Tax=Rhamnusium bicolor TaxID=1586634 RepID=A0AAV8WSR3_9CUCU|nr:hypothetical protein NQ314_017860 [Rhamnusium bicolor]